MPESSRQLVAIMFTDIVGYTALMGDEEEKAFELLDKNRALQKPLIEAYRGKWIKELGDGVLATFSTVSDAVYCAAAIQQESKDDPDLNLRIGIHQGEAVFKDGDVFGDGVNIASRIEALTASGEIWVSEAVSRNIQNKHGIEVRFVKEEQLRNVKDLVKIYEIKVKDIEPPSPERRNQVTEPSQSKSISKGIYLTLVAIVFALLLYLGYTKIYNSPTALEEDVTIAVLAFDDQSPNGDQEWLGDGMADEILNVLAKVKGLQVTGKTSSFSFKGKGLTTKEIGETLNVSTVLEGSVSKIGDKLRITAQLIDVETDAHIWSKKYDRDASDIFMIVDEVAQSIALSLRSELSIKEVSNIKMAYQPSPEAYEYFIKAENIHDIYFVRRRAGIDGLFKQAKEMYLKAISIDPEYMDGLAGLANLYDTRGNGSSGSARSADFSVRDSIIQVAYQKDTNSPYVLYLKGYLSDDLDSAFDFFKRGFAIDPHNKGIVLIGYTYLNLGLYHSCISFSKQYLASDPLNANLNFVYLRSLFRVGKIEEAKVLLINALEYDSDNYGMYLSLFNISLVNRDTAKAKILSKKLSQLDTDSTAHTRRQSLLFAIEGKKEEALKGNTSPRVHIILGMNREALQQMDTIINSLDIPYSHIFSYLSLKSNPYFNGIRDEPQYQEWLKEAKVVHEERVRKYGHLFDEK